MSLSHRSMSIAEAYDDNSRLETEAIKTYVSDYAVLRSSARLVRPLDKVNASSLDKPITVRKDAKKKL